MDKSPFLGGVGEEITNALRLCDTLKASYRQTSSAQYLELFYRLREAALGTPQTLKEHRLVALKNTRVIDCSITPGF